MIDEDDDVDRCISLLHWGGEAAELGDGRTEDGVAKVISSRWLNRLTDRCPRPSLSSSCAALSLEVYGGERGARDGPMRRAIASDLTNTAVGRLRELKVAGLAMRLSA